MLCRNSGKCFTVSPYYREIYYTKVSQRRRSYFKNGILEVKKEPMSHSENHVVCSLYYKDRYLTSWTDISDRIEVRDLIAAVCRTLDAVLGEVGQ